MDLFLGDSDGRELCQQLKKHIDLRHIPILLYSAATVPSTSIEQSMAAGFIPKPFDIRELIGKVHSLVGAN